MLCIWRLHSEWVQRPPHGPAGETLLLLWFPVKQQKCYVQSTLSNVDLSRKKKFDLSCVRTMTGNKGKARSLYFGPKSVNRMLLSTEKKHLLETGKTSPPSFKELLQILGRFVQVWTVLSDFWPLCPFLCTSVGFRTLSFDFERFRPISDTIVRFQMAIIRFWIFAFVFGHSHPFSNTFRQMLRDHPIACFRPIQDESVRWFLAGAFKISPF